MSLENQIYLAIIFHLWLNGWLGKAIKETIDFDPALYRLKIDLVVSWRKGLVNAYMIVFTIKIIIQTSWLCHLWALMLNWWDTRLKYNKDHLNFVQG